MNRKLIICLIIGVLGIVIATTVYSSLKENSLNPQLKTVVAKVNGIEVTKAEYLNQKLFMEKSKGGKVDRKQVLREIGRKDKLVECAKQSGIHVSDAELEAFIESQKQLISQADPEAQSKFRDVLKGQGLTEAEYWSSPKVREGYKNGMYIGRLRAKISKELALPDEERHSQKASQLMEEKLIEYMGKIDIEVVDRDFE